MQHVVFFDGTCGLCDHLVQWLLIKDKKKQFLFAPLQGETAKKELQQEFQPDSMVLIENYQAPNQKITYFGKAALRVLWLIGGPWKILGSLHFLPAFLYNWIYWLVAKNRKKFFGEICLTKNTAKDRFLP